MSYNERIINFEEEIKMLESIIVGAIVFFIIRRKDIKETIKEYKQFRYEESLSTEERMRIRGIL